MNLCTFEKIIGRPLEDNEAKYYSLFEYASDAIIVLDFTGRILDVNENMCKLTGYSREELLEMNVSELMAPDELKNAPLRFQQVMEGQHLSSERKTVKKDGTVAIVEHSAKRIDNDRIMSILRDKTDLRTVQKQIALSESLFRNAFENSAVGMGLVSLEGRWINVNKKLCRIVGYSEEEFTQLTFQDITYPEDLGKDLEHLRQCLEGKIDVYQMEKRYIHKDGSIIWINLIASLIRDDQRIPLYFVSQVEDITERRKISEELQESELKFRTLVEQTLVGVYIIKDGKFSYVNPRYADIFGYQPHEMIGTFPAGTVVWPEDRHLYNAHTEDRISGRVKFVHYEARGQRKTGEAFWAEILGATTHYQGGPAIIGTLLDISERKAQQEIVNEYNKQLKDLAAHLQEVREEERYIMSREIHDELGQQLTALKLEVSFLRFLFPGDEAQQKIKDILELVSGTIGSVRKIATDLRPSILDDIGLVPALQWQTQEFEKRSGIRSIFKSNFSELNLEARHNLALFRIYQESLTNIMRHAGASEVFATLSNEDGYLRLIVQDNGRGFDVNSLKSKKSLGLVGIKERALLMNGNLEIQSTPGMGTSLSLTIPLTNS